jgi:hypothetical protein
MTILRFNNVLGTVASGAVTLTNTGGAGDNTATFATVPNFPVAITAPDIAKLVAEPDTPQEEITYITAYTPGALTATVLRAQEGTTKIAHAGTAWRHGPTAADFMPPGNGTTIVKSRTAGDLTPVAGWAAADTALDVVIPVVAGTVLAITPSAMCNMTATASGMKFDAQMVTSGNYVSSGNTTPLDYGVPGWFVGGVVNDTPGPRGTVYYTVQPADISGGVVTVRFMVNGVSSGQLLYANVREPLTFQVSTGLANGTGIVTYHAASTVATGVADGVVAYDIPDLSIQAVLPGTYLFNCSIFTTTGKSGQFRVQIADGSNTQLWPVREQCESFTNADGTLQAIASGIIVISSTSTIKVRSSAAGAVGNYTVGDRHLTLTRLDNPSPILSSSGGTALHSVFTSRTGQVGGNITIAANQTSVELAAATGGPGSGGFDLTLPAAAGDVIELGVLASASGGGFSLDFATMVGGSAVNWVGQSAGGLWSVNNGLFVFQSSTIPMLAGSVLYTVVPGDLSGGNVTFRIFYGSGSTARTLWRSSSNGLFAVSAVSLGSSSASNGLLTVVSFTPTSSYSITSTSFVDVDAANLAVTIIAPASGQVLIEVDCAGAILAAANAWFCLREGTTNIGSQLVTSANNATIGLHASFLVSGLTPGSSHTYKLGAMVASSTLDIWGGAGSGTVTMKVWSTGSASTLGDTTWTAVGATGAPTFQNSWANFGGVFPPAQFRKLSDGMVVIEGLVTGGADGTVVFTLPVGYRPVKQVRFAQSGQDGVIAVAVDPTGNVLVFGNGDTGSPTIVTGHFAYINCSFFAEQ